MLRIPVLAILAVSASIAGAQEAPATAAPCRTSACRIVFDWGGESAASHGSDRRYGPAADVEILLPKLLSERGLRVITTGDAPILVTVRPKVRRAMCDQMAGTDTDYSCKTIGEMQIQFASSDSVRAPNSIRVTNRCGAGDTFMTVAEFARLTADLVTYQLAEEKTRGRRPGSKC